MTFAIHSLFQKKRKCYTVDIVLFTEHHVLSLQSLCCHEMMNNAV